MNGISFRTVPVPTDEPFTGSEWWGKWWEHPDRNCKGRYEFTDSELHPQHGRGHKSNRQRAFIEALKRDCMACPVLIACRIDALSRPDSELFGVQAGLEGRW